ncbi:hypothetical protein A3D11_03265 [Candidatus Peribacteria bacterium RIFCSPHIGHO2_02_FULL_49_16]|nr:MAG: hypothetical protein A2880_03135 [Candidatus Peribacteria bacterium RIFCSPHIGHO2_01_FULL_49_38]OGJ59337.1 MAG: hypothetical protein A3D11_03265 [Candidatus Peribacteria bacterium RIFCSPHIGHO2_02_FULL_49_16]
MKLSIEERVRRALGKKMDRCRRSQRYSVKELEEGSQVIRGILALPTIESSPKQELIDINRKLIQNRIRENQLLTYHKIEAAKKHVMTELKKMEKCYSPAHFAVAEEDADQKLRECVSRMKMDSEDHVKKLQKECDKSEAEILALFAESPQEMAEALRSKSNEDMS